MHGHEDNCFQKVRQKLCIVGKQRLTWGGVRPVKENMPIWLVMKDQSLSGLIFSKLSLSTCRTVCKATHSKVSGQVTAAELSIVVIKIYLKCSTLTLVRTIVIQILGCYLCLLLQESLNGSLKTVCN